MRPLTPSFVPAEGFERLRGERWRRMPFPGLYVCGSIEMLAATSVAIVGTRAASSQGRRLARTLAVDLAAQGIVILSGLALGIDAAAHEGALLNGGGLTVAVLGGGHGCFFPRRNQELAEQMLAAGGAVLSPYAPDHPAQPHQFLARNGVVAALADALVVVEAPARSGALNTAGWAAGQIPVMAVPGDVDRPSAAGCLALIRDGATLVRNARDILEELGINAPPKKPQLNLAAPSDPVECAILTALADSECGFDSLLSRCEVLAPKLLAALTRLELGGRIEVRPGARYACINPSSSV